MAIKRKEFRQAVVAYQSFEYWCCGTRMTRSQNVPMSSNPKYEALCEVCEVCGERGYGLSEGGRFLLGEKIEHEESEQ